MIALALPVLMQFYLIAAPLRIIATSPD